MDGFSLYFGWILIEVRISFLTGFELSIFFRILYSKLRMYCDNTKVTMHCESEQKRERERERMREPKVI